MLTVSSKVEYSDALSALGNLDVTSALPKVDTSEYDGLSKRFAELLEKLPKPDKPIAEANIYGDGGAKPNPGSGAWGIWGSDSENTEYDAWGYGGDNVSNNRAELFGYIRILEIILHMGFKHTNVYLDSEYVLKGAKYYIHRWVHNGWKTANGDLIGNPAEWKHIQVLQEQVKAQGLTLHLSWVKGHSGVPGNEKADANATKARLAGEKGFKDPVLSIGKIGKELVSVEEKLKVTPCTRLIAGKKLVFTTNTVLKTTDGLSIYLTNSFEDKEGMGGKYIGKPSSDNLHGVVLTKEPIKPLDALIDYQNKITPNDFVQPVSGILGRILRPDVWEMLSTYGDAHLNHKRLNIRTVEKEPLTLYIRPPRLAYDAITALYILLERLERWRFDKQLKHEEYVDITDSLYTKEKKTWKLNKEIQSTSKSISVPLTHAGKSITVTLTIGIDLPPRSNLSALGKETKHLQVTLVKFDSIKTGFRYSVIFKTDTDYAIYTTINANLKTV